MVSGEVRLNGKHNRVVVDTISQHAPFFEVSKSIVVIGSKISTVQD